jgi:hypothetical protein
MSGRKLLFLLLLLCGASLEAQPIAEIPLPNAHAHNDYAHARPLWDALAQGFTSVEADVFLMEGELYVYHDRPARPDPTRTLRSLYLEPLKKILESRQGALYPGYDVVFYLMIDIKENGEEVYRILKRQLEPYRGILTSYQGRKINQGPVTIFLSGDRPISTILAEDNRLVALDGRPEDIGKGIDPAFMPVISDRYGKHFSWRGEGEIPTSEWRKMRILVANAHAEGKKVRFWASPEKEAVWTTLLRAQVDLINTDELARLRVFLRP